MISVSWSRAWLVLALLLSCGAAAAQSAPEGEPINAKPLSDREFGVGSRQFGLERQVEMYQWRKGADGYERVWNAAHIDSEGFAGGHQNPAGLPLESRRCWAERVTLDGHPLDSQVLRALGNWQQFRPSFAHLPANLAASFQPEGDGLGSGENPLAPQIGDLRIHWRELVLPPLAGKVELRAGSWRLTARAAAAPPVAQQVIEIEDPVDVPGRGAWPWAVAAALVLAAAAGLWLRRRSHHGGSQ